MKKFIYSIIFLVLFSNLSGQEIYNKTGGVCFRFDDHQSAYKWRDLNTLFNKYGYKFNLALNPERILTDTAANNALHEVEASGHELMEHTPSHTTAFISFSTAHKQDSVWFIGRKGIDHITMSTGRVCLKVDTFYTENFTGEGKVHIYGDLLISADNGGFKDLNTPVYYSNIYLPTKKLLTTWNSLQNKNPNDPDTIKIQSYWQEAVKLDTVLNTDYERLTVNDIKMTDDALKMLVDRSFYIYDSLGFTRPKSWIQPGGSFAQLSKEDAKRLLGGTYGFTAAATYVQPAYKMYNEADGGQNKRFALQNPDFSDENNTLEAMINSIADNSARHINSFTLSHLNPKIAWTDYIARMDSLLAWIKDNNIPVYRFNEWASILFDSVPNPYANVIPEFHKDLNQNSLPDGLAIGVGTLDSSNGVARSGNIGYSRTANGGFFSINSLGGFEKGWNRFSVYTRGPGAKDSVRIGIGFPEIPNSQMYFNLAANTPDWNEVSTMIYLDPNATRMTFQISASRNVSTGSVQISGVQLRRLSNIKVNTLYTNKITTNNFFGDVPNNAFVIDSAYKPGEFKVLTTQGNEVMITVDSASGKITVRKPSLFWVGKDSVKITATNNDKTTDSGYIYFNATYPGICIGESVTLKGSPAFGTGYKWTIGTGTTNADSVVVSPTVPRWYKVEYTGLMSNTVTDSIFITVDTLRPEITFTKDTTLCEGKNALLTLTNTGNISWWDTKGNQLEAGNTLHLSNLTVTEIGAPQKVYMINAIKSCTVRDSVNIHVNTTKIIQQPFLYREFTQGITTTTGFRLVVPNGVQIIALNTPINTFTVLLDSVSYVAPLSFRGADSVVYLVTDSMCAYDTITLKVVVTQNLATPYIGQPNLTIFPNPADNHLYLRTNETAIISIYNILGRCILTRPVTEGDNDIDVSSLGKGVYLLTLQTETGTITRRFIKE